MSDAGISPDIEGKTEPNNPTPTTEEKLDTNRFGPEAPLMMPEVEPKIVAPPVFQEPIQKMTGPMISQPTPQSFGTYTPNSIKHYGGALGSDGGEIGKYFLGRQDPLFVNCPECKQNTRTKVKRVCKSKVSIAVFLV